MPGEVDWTDPLRIPLGFAHGGRGGSPTPEGVQANLFTLCQIGGLYDYIAIHVEQDHLEMLTAWRLDSKAPTVLDYLRERDRKWSQVNTPNERRNHA